jgi:uncharacterized protein YdeI (YjbR/CyaY-like superfamily)
VSPAEEQPIVEFATAAEWRAWLEEHHADTDGVRMKIAKKGKGVQTVAYPEVLDVALCFGWIDGVRRRFDDVYFLQTYTPRRKRSKWSQINREKAEALIASGEMHAAGLSEVDRAKADGRWDAAYEPQSTATVPDDLQAAFDANPGAAEFFATLNSQNRYAVLFRIRDAKKPETRARRIAKFAEMLARGEKIYP